MNVSGHRISTIEVESALVDHKSVAEAAVVGKNDPITGQAIFAYVILRRHCEPSEGLAEELRGHVAKVIGPIAKPKFLFLPRPAQDPLRQDHAPPAARHRRRARSGDTTTLADPNVVETIRAESWKAED
jgi:acetyl-CoA synthetase